MTELMIQPDGAGEKRAITREERLERLKTLGDAWGIFVDLNLAGIAAIEDAQAVLSGPFCGRCGCYPEIEESTHQECLTAGHEERA